MEEFEQTRSLDLVLRRFLPWQVRRRFRARREPEIRALLVKLNVGSSVQALGTALSAAPLLTSIVLRLIFAGLFSGYSAQAVFDTDGRT